MNIQKGGLRFTSDDGTVTIDMDNDSQSTDLVSIRAISASKTYVTLSVGTTGRGVGLAGKWSIINESNVPGTATIMQSAPRKDLDQIRKNVWSATEGVADVYIGNGFTTEEVAVSGRAVAAPVISDILSRLRGSDGSTIGEPGTTRAIGRMSGLCLKTYMSDRFTNWLDTEMFEALTAKSTINISSGMMTIDTLNLSQKLYNINNRIFAAGQTYEDWLLATWGSHGLNRKEIPMYIGGVSSEVYFDTVISKSETDQQPLGSLAGRGDMLDASGNIVVDTGEEPCYVMAIASLTPRLDYSQGNKWFTRLKNMDQLHKPELNGIGFQDLITDEMAAFDTEWIPLPSGVFTPVYKSAGKQVAWQEYMTDQNECFGDFGVENQMMFMTLNRQFEPVAVSAGTGPEPNGFKIGDLTSYVDPQKYNYAFADTSLGARNFWLQIGFRVRARRKVANKQIPTV